MKKYMLPLGVLLVVGAVSSTQARMHVWFDDDFFFDDTFFDRMREMQERAVKGMNSYFNDRGPSKKEREALKTARENLAQVTLDVKEDDDIVTISLTGFDGLAKKDVKVARKGTSWLGTITVKDGRIEFIIDPRGVRVDRLVEIKKEEKTDKKKKNAKETPEQRRVFYSSSSVSEGRSFKTLVDVSTLKAHRKPTEFILTVDKQKEELLEIS